jgi:hypothetical protein
VNPDTEQVGYHAQRVTKEQAARAEALVRRMCPDPDPVLAALGLAAPVPAADVCRNGHPRTADNTRTRVKDGQESKECVDCERERRGRQPRPAAVRRGQAPPEGYCRNGHRRTDSNTRYEGEQVRCKDCRRDYDRRKRSKQ